MVVGGEEAEGVRWEWVGGLWEGWVGVAIFGRGKGWW